MKSFYFIWLSLFVILMISCNKDSSPSNCEKLEGTWKAESWKNDTTELLGINMPIINSDLIFKTLADTTGDFEWITNYQIGGMDDVIGGYKVNDACDEVIITPNGGAASEDYNFHFEGNLLIMEGTIFGVDTKLNFSKQE
ncbi:MAG: hypothetical protein ABJC12_05335 [Saprospiraceae bacterium]